MTTMTIESGAVLPELPMRLELARRAAGYTQTQLAEAIGMSDGTVKRCESGRHPVKRPILVTWAMATGVSTQWLETGTAPTGDGGGQNEQDPHSARNEGLTVRHQGLEPRTRCLSVMPAQAA